LRAGTGRGINCQVAGLGSGSRVGFLASIFD
jgi:hypothetical protein